MDNEMKAKRLEEIAETFERLGDADAALLRESAQLWREQPGDGWDIEYEMKYKRRKLVITRERADLWYWMIDPDEWGNTTICCPAETLAAAKAAAIQWVDAQEGK
jgi:hypothetical protein